MSVIRVQSKTGEEMKISKIWERKGAPHWVLGEGFLKPRVVKSNTINFRLLFYNFTHGNGVFWPFSLHCHFSFPSHFHWNPSSQQVPSHFDVLLPFVFACGDQLSLIAVAGKNIVRVWFLAGARTGKTVQMQQHLSRRCASWAPPQLMMEWWEAPCCVGLV